MSNTLTMNRSGDLMWRLFIALGFSSLILMLPDMALASGDAAISNALCTVVGWLNGKTGRAIATIAIIVVGVMALAGALRWTSAIIVAVGVAIVFGASALVGALGASGTSC